MAELEVIDSLGNKELLKINDLQNPDKEIYDYCLSKKYDYKKVKELKNQLNKKYKINPLFTPRKKKNEILLNSSRNFNKRSLSVSNRKKYNKNYLFPFQIIISKTPRNFSLKNIHLSNRTNLNKSRTINKTSISNNLSLESSHDKILSKGRKFDKEEFDKRFEKILIKVIKSSDMFKEDIQKQKEMKKNKSLKNPQKVNYGDVLYIKGKQFEENKKNKIKDLEKKLKYDDVLKGYSYRPKTNSISERALNERKRNNREFDNPEIIGKYYKYKEDIIQKAKQKQMKELYEKNQNETFQPVINKKSKSIKNNYNTIYEKLYNDRKIKEKKLKKLKKKEENMYSFHPHLNNEYKLKYPNNSIFIKYQNIIQTDDEDEKNYTNN
jgi:hypothetical protein